MVDPVRLPDLHPQLTRRILQVSDSIGEFMEYWGFKAIHGRVWSLLALRNVPMSQSDLARSLGVSRSLMSGVMSELEGYGVVRPTSQARNAPWEAVVDVWPTISDVLRGREWGILENVHQSLEAALEEAEIAQSRGEFQPYDLSRIKWLLAMTQTAQRLLRLLISLRSTQGVENLGGWVSRASALIRGAASRLHEI